MPISERDLPGDVRLLIDRWIPSLEALEVLLLVHDDKQRSWSAAELAARIHVRDSSAVAPLVHWTNVGLLDDLAGKPPRYRYGTPSADLEQAADSIVQAYGERRIAVINYVAARTLDRLREFADAFSLNRDDEG
jgi:hypothetical protein